MSKTIHKKSVFELLQAKHPSLAIGEELARAQNASDRAEGVVVPQHRYRFGGAQASSLSTLKCSPKK